MKIRGKLVRGPQTQKIDVACREINQFGKAIGNAPRYIILEALQKSPKTVGQLTKITNLTQPAVSQHLKMLQQCGLVNGFKNGKQVTYKINVGRMLKLLDTLTQALNKKHN